MIGIYKIKNKINGKIYIGQSTDIAKRWNEHKRCKDNCVIHKAIRKYGAENFEFSVIQECLSSQLDDLEAYYIQEYHSVIPLGYNMTLGGVSPPHKKGVDNPNSVLNEQLVYEIRELYTTDISKSQAYNLCKNLISLNTFADVWNGKTWKHIHYDVYTNENKRKHKCQKNRTHFSTINENDVLFIRDCKNKGMLKSDVLNQYFPNMNKNTFSDVWQGNTFKNIQSSVPCKKCDYSKQYKKISGVNNCNAIFTKSQIIDILNQKNTGKTMGEVRKNYPNVNRHTFSGVWHGRTYKDIYKQICNDYS